jgi:hypothetical protein
MNLEIEEQEEESSPLVCTTHTCLAEAEAKVPKTFPPKKKMSVAIKHFIARQ